MSNSLNEPDNDCMLSLKDFLIKAKNQYTHSYAEDDKEDCLRMINMLQYMSKFDDIENIEIVL
jgi:hypothetical protein